MTSHPVNTRLRKAVGGVAMLLFLGAYVIAAVNLGDHIPDNKLIKLVYFVVAGTLWGVPLIPLITWMNRER